ncbi:hypothetical protein BV25DRAFT_1297301 [Artomyces pyxidatus]|uniref:Uncharacterized protein n=1 Tax=Artomyces pyxidatus TaxID=48021 RepID=A0ACB8SQH2_9AGAM|nr:hypothetical protein BV25DRAFT_1297301 [Artomyces pyxidatus]
MHCPRLSRSKTLSWVFPSSHQFLLLFPPSPSPPSPFLHFPGCTASAVVQEGGCVHLSFFRRRGLCSPRAACPSSHNFTSQRVYRPTRSITHSETRRTICDSFADMVKNLEDGLSGAMESFKAVRPVEQPGQHRRLYGLGWDDQPRHNSPALSQKSRSASHELELDNAPFVPSLALERHQLGYLYEALTLANCSVG